MKGSEVQWKFLAIQADSLPRTYREEISHHFLTITFYFSGLMIAKKEKTPGVKRDFGSLLNNGRKIINAIVEVGIFTYRSKFQ